MAFTLTDSGQLVCSRDPGHRLLILWTAGWQALCMDCVEEHDASPARLDALAPADA